MSAMDLEINQLVAISNQSYICEFDLLFEGHRSLDITTVMKDPNYELLIHINQCIMGYNRLLFKIEVIFANLTYFLEVIIPVS